MECRYCNYIKKVPKPYIIGFRHSVVFFRLLTSSLRTPKILVKEFCYFLMPCHKHGLCIDILI